MAKQHSVFHPSALALAIGLSLAPALIGLSVSHAAPPAKKATAQPQPITLNFVNAEIESVARTLATLSNRNLVVDPRVKGTINLTTELPVSPNEAWSQFLAALRLQGFAMVETKGLYKIVPEADAKLQGGNVQEIDRMGGITGNGQIVTHIFKLNFEQANNLLPVLRPLISPNNTINVNPGNNSIIITDYADNLQRMARIIATLDVSNASDVEVIQLKHAIAVDLAPLVLRLVESGSNMPQAAATPGQTGAEYKTTLLAEPRSNALILRAANPARVALVKSLVAKLDQPNGTSASGNIHVVYLKNADATKLATTLRAAVSGQATGTTGTAATLNTTATPTASPLANNAASTGSTLGSTTATSGSATGGQIQADTATNSLIITAPEPQYRQLRAVIDMLDQRRAQVMVESLIAEVNADKAAEMGIQWQNATGNAGGTIGIIGTNFNNPITTTVGQGNILSVSGGASTALSALGGGLNIGSARQINGTYVLSSLATFLQQNGEGNVLSTPTLLTLDNEEAKIVVGQNVPFVTGQYTNNNTTNGSVNPFQTVERKDVGLTLKVKPQISETGTVKLTIFQEVSSVVPNSVGSTTGLITNKRSIESNVLVDDGSIIVLGGLLSDEYSGGASQVPLFGDIPLVGWLFKSESRSRTKKNLMVFLRPVVMRDAAASDALSNSRYQQMLGLQQNAQPGFNPVLGSGNSPVLPPAPAPKSKDEPKTSGDSKTSTPQSAVPTATPAQ
ncbi:MAG: type II secretion system protein GspD [Burkholderiales bacterium 35-55-47]|jgi:general secretion pathway protein D|uniref:type II secretion system secretin GspD n=1 Tax=Limnohabitans sp. TaxID=1907725 RepID=UPI000BCDD3EE|nr:type II secretion system secretin GspD [Limnohabitans sp.]OYY17626.1 MAG: type II secretion system protein GspD [Burkholderiales bacterium 35-55-47]OYZ72007.1 MAG: type II secretion system protein GspD [Burkholderiales bacterium 24-55-52]OZA99018.1 MAG: type II secretion system protein GspD [Burkholderiales bacterium 39-55-53]HQR86920.1 type II secretion system secretin GspD [Limnohabitans sp.]HQS26982.1 type II secretion system secretin GspD [Limnohabitans sp.]